MQKQKEILKRYYQGATTLPEEQTLRQAYQQGELPDDPVLAYKGISVELPEELSLSIQANIRKRQNHHTCYSWIITGSIAAMVVLIISLRSFLPVSGNASLQLSDNLKKERFEDALKMIGSVLEEKTPPMRKVLYEDHNLIITIE